jgi:uncharacterized membrane protein
MTDFTEKTQQVKETIKREVDKIPPTTDHNLMAALSYIWVLSLLMLLFKRNDPYISFHARQGLVLNAMCLVWWIPLFGWIIFALSVTGMVLGFMNAWQGKEWKIPYIYQLSQWVKSKGL